MKNNRKNGRIVIKNIIVLFIFFSILGTFMTFSSAKEEIVTKEYIVCEDDTLWTISSKICKKSNKDNLNIQNIIKDIKNINNLENSNIYEGQTIKLPVY